MKQSLFEDLESLPIEYATVHLRQQDLLEPLAELKSTEDVSLLRSGISELKRLISSPVIENPSNGDLISLRRDVLDSELDQILESRTIERARYYIKRLERGIQKVRTSQINDINLNRWKEYSDIVTDSLWVLPRRDTAGAHLGWYWGNFIPQIPHQLLLRYTKRNDWVLDPFVGSGTTLIECKRLGRNGIGIDLNADVCERAKDLVSRERNRHRVTAEVVKGDARAVDQKSLLERFGIRGVQLLLMHPPYHDIISFSEEKSDLSNAETVDGFLSMFGEALDNTGALLERGRYFALVIGDKYSKGEWIPLGFYCMNEVLKRDFSLKSIVVKNFEETRAKREQKQLWRYRALVGGFYIFKHEYIFLFKKK